MSHAPFTKTGLLIAALALGACAHRAAPSPAETPPLATSPTIGQEVGAAVKNKLEVQFDTNSTVLTADGNAQLDIAAKLFRDVSPTLMFVSGHADSRGNEFPNVILSANRARTVKDALVARGIPPDRLLIQALGSSDPKDSKTPDADENRRVVITWRLL